MEMKSKRNQVRTYLQAIFFGSSTSRYEALSRYATKKVNTMSMPNNALTMLSVIERGFSGFVRNPNSNGETQAV